MWTKCARRSSGSKAAFVFEVGPWASAASFADDLALCGIEGRVHSVDLVKVGIEHPGVAYYQSDGADPERLFDFALLRAQPQA